MIMTRRIKVQLTALGLAGVLLAMGGMAAELSATGSPGRGNSSGPAFHHISPVEYFRGLLGMSPAERDRVLAKKSPADRALILAKIQEYEALPRPVREARLCQTELHWEMATLMRLPESERSNRLDEISALYRPMVEALLKQWDQVPKATQKVLLENEGFIGTFLRMQGSSEAARQEMLDKLPADRRARWAKEMDRWQALPENQRAELCAQFQHFFNLTDQAQKQTIDALSPSERKEMEGAVRTFDSLPAPQRQQCIASFSKFATMAPRERAQFLKNAARWESMSPHERALWRELVHRLPPAPPGFGEETPPMPPGLGEAQMSMSMPPMPPSVIDPVVIARSTNELR